ncbi:MAG: hypothetical protein ACD_79C00837G0001 [uncultured bacterium]|nr:MAG: hypothetical protein ACD_79C00837G0001 [uncultured bacterium]
MTWKVRGVRGATTVENNSSEEIIEESKNLLMEMLKKNNVPIEEICSIFFTVTPDLDKEFPAKAARLAGLVSTPLLCMTEIPVECEVKKCIRILIHLNTEKKQDEMIHIYLKDAQKLRPDLSRK